MRGMEKKLYQQIPPINADHYREEILEICGTCPPYKTLAGGSVDEIS